VTSAAGRLPVLAAVEGGAEAALVVGLERSASGVRVARRCADLAEVLAAAAAGLGRAAVLSSGLPRLDRDAVWQLQAGVVAVVGLADPADDAAAGRLTGWGVRQALPADAAPEQVAEAVLAAVAVVAEVGDGDVPPPLGPALTAPRPTGGPDPDGGPPTDVGDPGAPPGRLVAVWGPAGAPGRTTVALTLAAELAALEPDGGRGVLLVDADTYGASIAQSLAMLDETAGLAAVRAANNGSLDLPRLAALAPLAAPGLRVLTGLSRPQRWPELRQSGLVEVMDRARDLCRWVVVDCGFCLEADEELSFDTRAPRRNAATLVPLEVADLVVAVGAAEPVGLQRLVRGLQELRDVVPPGTPVRVVVNRVRASAVGDSPQARVGDALQRFAAVPDPVLVPDDRAGCDAVLLAGRTLTDCAAQSPARAALAGFAATLAGVAGRSGWRQALRARRRSGGS
jgi:MinD-like ATPase involved in chromosome partitioning or flagellar assembly